MDNTTDNIINSSIPTVRIFGLGGAGLNTVRAVKNIYADRASFMCFDTSLANTKPGEDTIILAGGSGSGKIRKTNADPIAIAFANMSDEELALGDVNICVFSASGGSGSVSGPLFIAEIASRQDKIANRIVALVIIDTDTEINARNSLNTLQSIHNLAEQHNIYLPITIFNNSCKGGKRVVDMTIVNKLNWLVHMLTIPTFEIDRNDRRNFLAGNETVNAPPGMKLLHVAMGTDAEASNEDIEASGEMWAWDDNFIVDSIMNISANGNEVNRRVKARVAFEGHFTANQTYPVIGVVGGPPSMFDNIMAGIKSTLKQFGAQSHSSTSTFGNGDVGKHGMVL